jgi:hypothetical protein
MLDGRSVRHLSLGVMVAARRNGELGFFLRQNGGFEPLDAPGKGDEPRGNHLFIAGRPEPLVAGQEGAYHISQRGVVKTSDLTRN